MKTIRALLILLAAVYGMAAQTTGWKTFTPPAGHFSIAMPAIAEPKEEKQTTPTSPVGPYTTYLYSVTADRVIYMAGWVDYAPTLNLNVPSEIAKNRDNFVKQIKARVVSERSVNYGSSPGLEFTAETDAVTVRSRIYVIGKRPYMLITVGSKGRDISASVDKFFTSFKTGGR